MYSQLLSALLLLSSPALSTPTPGKGKGEDCDIIVHPGQSIQSAINSAKPGSKIVVEDGTYYEQLTITTSGIHLRSKGAVLYPPQNGYTPNFCTGLSKSFEPPLGDNSDTNAGICIHGSGFELAPYERALQHRKINKTGHYIEDVKVSGFEIRNFTGEAIALIGGKDVSVKHNHMVDNHQYGFLTVGSYDTHAEHNVVTSSMLDFIALCMDDAAGAVFRKNHISNYYIALCTQTSGGLVMENTVENCCFGPFVDPGIFGAKVIGNSISKRNDGCLPEQGAGIAVLGAKETLVEKNYVEKFQFNMTGLGVLVSDDPATGTKAEGNIFRKNTLKQNDLDIYAEGTAAANTFEDNDCASSLPFGICEN